MSKYETGDFSEWTSTERIWIWEVLTESLKDNEGKEHPKFHILLKEIVSDNPNDKKQITTPPSDILFQLPKDNKRHIIECHADKGEWRIDGKIVYPPPFYYDVVHVTEEKHHGNFQREGG